MATLAVGERARMYAQAGVMRAGASRANFHSTQTFVKINGVQYAAARAVAGQQVDNETLTITETEGETPNTCEFAVRGFTPTDGQDVVITMGSINNLEREFAGTVLTDTHGYAGSPANGKDVVNVIDYTWQLTRDTISQRWTNTSATVIAQAIIAVAAARGFTSLRVEANLPVVDEFSVTNQTLASALENLAERIGAYWKVTYTKDVRFGIAADVSQTDPTVLTPASALLTEMIEFSVARDLSQVITRQPVEGGGSNALTEVPPGETILPVEDEVWYNALGGLVVSGPQRLSYTGVQPGGAGTVVGPSAAPVVAPTLTPAVGAGLNVGFYGEAYTFITAAGESLPSPVATVALGTSASAPTSAPTVNNTPTGNSSSQYAIGDTLNEVYTYSAGANNGDYTRMTAVSPATTVVVVNDGFGFAQAPLLIIPMSSDPTITFVLLWRQVNGGGYKRIDSIVNVPGNIWTIRDATTPGVALPAASLQIAPSAITLGPSGTTQRKVYRTVVQTTAAAALTAQLKLQQTIANNTATVGVQDATADGSLGANAPTVDTSGLTTTTGRVLAGATSILTPSAGPFSATGGWAISGQQRIRYTGLSGNTLTGIPAAGYGAILSTLTYGDHLDPAPALTGIPASGIGAILYTIKQGDPVNLRVVVDDVAAQAAIAALMGGTDDGIIEGAVIQDGRISETEARARGTAQLALRSPLAVTVNYQTRDKNTHAGRSIGVNLPAAPTSTVGTFKLLSVTSSDYLPARWPKREAVGSSNRFTLEMLLRYARGGT